jgi:hypothetical protein
LIGKIFMFFKVSLIFDLGGFYKIIRASKNLMEAAVGAAFEVTLTVCLLSIKEKLKFWVLGFS